MWFQKNYLDEANELKNLVSRYFDTKKEEVSKNPIPVNVYETKDKVFAVMPLAGVKKENIEINYQNRNLSIKTKKEIETEEALRVLRRERQAGEYQRMIELSTPVKPESIKAKYENGFLIVEMDKAEEVKAKKITVL
ncbi:MAG TPA: Hsp20/alpha crystallin family protein [Spirochaetia bacterium]|nr:MAG: hypothetical protein A2Y41_09150 [Spirochaetes bacterium GWB1_36_13]HCL56576.1 Hsp20/alpha crystallin family protein [Spirochaetia bacterium]